MKLTVRNDLSQYINSTREYEISCISLEPAGTGICDEDALRVFTLSFASLQECARFAREQTNHCGVEDNCDDEGIWFIMFWKVPAHFTLEMKDSHQLKPHAKK